MPSAQENQVPNSVPNLNYTMKNFQDVIQRIKVESFDQEADMITASGHKTIEAKGKYRDNQLCRIAITTYELKDTVTMKETLGYGKEMPIAEFSSVRLSPLER